VFNYKSQTAHTHYIKSKRHPRYIGKHMLKQRLSVY